MATSFDNIYKKSKLKVCVCLLIFLNNVSRHFNHLSSGPNNSHSTFLRSRCCPRTSRRPPVTRARNSTVPESRRRTSQRGRRGARKDHRITICVTLRYALLWLFVVLLFNISNVEIVIVRYGKSVTFTVGHPGGVHPLLSQLRRGSGQHLEVPLPLLPEWRR